MRASALALKEQDVPTKDLPVKSNPRLFNEDVGALAWMGLGAGFTAYVNDSFLSGFTKSFVPGANTADNSAVKLVDAATTAGSAWVAGELMGFADKAIARDIRRGGLILAIAKGLSVVIPNFSLSAEFPKIFKGLSSLFSRPQPVPAVVLASSASAIGPGTLPQIAGPANPMMVSVSSGGVRALAI